MFHWTASRNIAMQAAADAGETVDELAARFQLRICTVRQILTDERNKLLVSPHSYYRALRAARKREAVIDPAPSPE